MGMLVAKQLAQALADRAQLLYLLSIDRPTHEEREQIASYATREELLCGWNEDWRALLASFLQDTGMLGKLPDIGHLFIQCVVAARVGILRGLLFDLHMDTEKEWDIPPQSKPWSAWLWISSIVLADGIPTPQMIDECWNMVIPLLIASGFDLEKPCVFSPAPSFTRRQWLEYQDPVRFQKACCAAQTIALENNTSKISVNSADRRL